MDWNLDLQLADQPPARVSFCVWWYLWHISHIADNSVTNMCVFLVYLRVAEGQSSHGPCSQHPLADLGDLGSLVWEAGSLVLWHRLGVWCFTVKHLKVVHQCLIPRLDHRLVLLERIKVITSRLSLTEPHGYSSLCHTRPVTTTWL